MQNAAFSDALEFNWLLTLGLWSLRSFGARIIEFCNSPGLFYPGQNNRRKEKKITEIVVDYL